MNPCFSNHCKLNLQSICTYVVALCLEWYGLLTQAADVPKFSSRCSWFEPRYFKLEKNQHTKCSFSGFLRVFQKLGMNWLTVTSPLLLLFFLPCWSWGSHHWLSFVSGVYKYLSGFGPSVDLHKGDLVTHAHLGICSLSNNLWKWSIVMCKVTCCSYNTDVIRKSPLCTFYSRQQWFF